MLKIRLWSIVVISTLMVVVLSGPAAGLLTDVAGHWAGPIIAALEARGIVSGDSAGRFDPDGQLTRAQFAKILVINRGNESDAKLLEAVSSRFTDLPPSHWARGFVESLAEIGVAEGFPDGSFMPSQPVTRAQAAVLLVRAAGLADQARLHRFEPTPFVDDNQVPNWSRGEINLAHRYGLITGFDDRSFRPNETMTRAQGAVATIRLAEYAGTAYHLVGTLVRFDPTTRQGVVRDALGRERTFTMSNQAQYFRSGIAVGPQAPQRLDQVWVVLGTQNAGLVLESRYADFLGSSPTVSGRVVTVQLASGISRSFQLQPGAMTFLNGLPINLVEGTTATHAYMALDVANDEVRMLDLVRVSYEGILIGTDPPAGTVTLSIDQASRSAQVSPNAVILQNGIRVTIQELRLGAAVQIAVDSLQAITYLQAEG